jgi:hypothetical protein
MVKKGTSSVHISTVFKDGRVSIKEQIVPLKEVSFSEIECS